MADRESRVLLSVVDKYSHGLAGFAGGMENAYSKVKGLQQGLQTLAGGGGGVAGAVIKTVIDATKYTIQWAGEIDLLSRVTGTGARETSKLAIVFGDVGIGLDVLRASARKMASEGLELNFKSIVALAKEYQALPPGVERSRFAMEKFGRAGGEMSEILDRDISEIEALGRAAEKSGKIVGDDFVKNAEKLETGMHQLQDRMEGFKILVGGPVIDTVNKAAQAETDWIGILQLVAVKAGQVTGIMSDQAASVKAAQIAGLSYEEAINQVYAAEVKMVDASDRLHESNTSLTSSYTPLGAGAMDAAYWIGKDAEAKAEAAKRSDELNDASAELAAGLSGPLADAANMTAEQLHKATNELIFQQLSADMDAVAALKLAETLGLIDPASAAAAAAAKNLSDHINETGASADSAAAQAKKLADAINALQDKSITITQNTIYYEERRQSGAYVPHEQSQGGMGGYQFGGLVPAMQTVMVGERGPELLRLDRPGRKS